MSIELPFPPSRNHTHVRARSGAEVPTKVYRKWMADARLLVQAACREMHPQLVRITFWLYWPDRRRSDADNRLKLVKDALSGILVKDDCWTCLPQEHIYNELDRDNPRVVVSWEA